MENSYHVILLFLGFYVVAIALGRLFPSRMARRGDYSGGAGDGLTGIYDADHGYFEFTGNDCNSNTGDSGGSCGDGGGGY